MILEIFDIQSVANWKIQFHPNDRVTVVVSSLGGEPENLLMDVGERAGLQLVEAIFQLGFDFFHDETVLHIHHFLFQ